MAQTNDSTPPLAVRVREATRMIGLGRTKLYELIKAGDLETVKIGRATLITMRSLSDLVGQ
jgi:excisionase family DNA binding protein